MAKRTKHIAGLILIGFFCIGILGCSNPVSEELDYTQGQLLVQLTEVLPQQEATDLAERYEIEFVEYFEYLGIVLVGVPEGQEDVWIETLEKDDLVVSTRLVRNNVTLR